jgi:RNA polymerase sigma factor (sigma-70 family)
VGALATAPLVAREGGLDVMLPAGSRSVAQSKQFLTVPQGSRRIPRAKMAAMGPSAPITSATNATELVLQARTGSPSALEELVRRYQRALYLRCWQHVQDHDVADDLTQTALIRAMQNLHTLQRAGNFSGWLFRIARNLAINHLRGVAKFAGMSALDGMTVMESGPDLDALTRSQTLRQAIAKLPFMQRRIVELRVYEELSFVEIARALHTSPNAAKTSFHYATRNLRRAMVTRRSGDGKTAFGAIRSAPPSRVHPSRVVTAADDAELLRARAPKIASSPSRR